MKHETSKKQVELLSTSEVLELTGISLPTLYRWLKKGSFPKPIKFSPNGKNFWRVKEINQHLEEMVAAVN